MSKKGKSLNGGELRNNTISLNTDEGDNLPCKRCGLFIPFMKSRENRVDCEGKQLESYHLECYDLELFGHVTKITLKKIERLHL